MPDESEGAVAVEEVSAKSLSREADELLAFLKTALTSVRFPAEPESFSGNEAFEEVLDYIVMLRDNLYRFSQGKLNSKITHKGFLAGCLKELQANLRHLTWHAERLADGDFNQRIDFMGNFSESFNRMTREFYNALTALRESESRLLRLTEELHVTEERWKLAVACTQDGIWDIDLIAQKAFLSPRLWEILRRPNVDTDIDFDPLVWGSAIHHDDREKWLTMVSGSGPRVDGRQYTEFRVCGGDGRYRWVGTHHMLLRDAGGVPYRHVGACEDIQEKREREEAIRMQATHDQLTGLPNRYLYNDRLLQQIVMAKRNDSAIVLAMWDLDGFKWVNDTYGHLAGDELLVGVANIMRSCLRETDTLARFGGDEFVMLLSSARGHETEVAAQTTARIFDALKAPIDIGTDQVRIGASCGIAFYPKHTVDGEQLFDFADKALYVAKRAGKNRAQVWISEKSEETKK